MAAITSAAAGFYDVTTTWTGGVVPVSGDTITINHAVEIRDARTVGSDPGNPTTPGSFAASVVVTIGAAGTLKFSRTASATLNCRGSIRNSGGTLDMGTDTNCASPFNVNSPIPSGVNAVIRFATSGNNIATGKYGYYDTSANGGGTFLKGVSRTRVTTLNGAHSAGAASITVNSASNWAVNDLIAIHTSSATSTHIEIFGIRSIAGSVVTLGLSTAPGTAATLVNARVTGTPVVNLTSNVTVGATSLFNCFFTPQVTGSTSARKVQCANAVFEYICAPNGVYGDPAYGGVGTDVNGTPAVQYDYFDDCAVYLGLGGFRKMGGSSYESIWNRLAVYHNTGNTNWFNSCQAITTYNNCVGLNTAGSGRFSSVSFGLPGYATYNDCYLVTGRQYQFDQCTTNFLNRCTIGGTDRPVYLNKATNSFNECLIGTFGTTGVATALTDISESSVVFPEFLNCQFVSGITIENQMQNVGAMAPAAKLRIINYNADPTLQELHEKTGLVQRDNSQLIRSRSSIKFYPKSANTPHGEVYSIPATAGVSVTFRFGLRYDTTYGVATPPSVTVSGLGITPQVFTAGGTANTDYQSTITVTPVTTGSLSITVVGQSTATTGVYWFSGMTVSPWIDWTQHYGYLYLPTSPTLTVDPIVVVSEATAAAYTGISFASNTLTITGTRSIREIYDWLKQYEASNRLAPIITSTDGINFTMNASLVVNAGQITGTSEVFTLSATRTWSFVSGGSTLIKVISPVSGTIATVSISVTCKNEAGSPVQNTRVYIEAGAGGSAVQGSILLNALTDAAGLASTTFVWTQDQPIQKAKARKSTSAPFYKEASIAGSVTISGLITTLILVGDE